MKTFLRALAVLAALSGPAEAATMTVLDSTSTPRTLGQGVDGVGDLLGATILCGAVTSGLYDACTNQVVVNALGQILTSSTLTGTLPGFTTPPSIANTAFGISGTLPGFTSPPAVTVAVLGSLTDTACTAFNTTSCSLAQLLRLIAETAGASISVNVGSTATPAQGKTAGGTTGQSVDFNSIAGVAIGVTKNTVAASVTAQALTGGSGGATGDYLSHCVITPGSTSPGNVIISDNATALYTFTGGASSVTTLISWPVPVGAVSTSGAWKVTTGANVTVFCVGKFT